MGIPKKTESFSEIKYYEDINELILYNFDRYMATKDNNWFIIGYTGREKKIESEKLKIIEANILDEYFANINDTGFTRKIHTWAKIDWLVTKYHIVSELLKIISMGFELSNEGQEMRLRFIKMLEQYRYKMPYINSPYGDIDECTKILNELQGVQTQISILNNSIKEQGKSEKISLQRQLQIATISLGYPHRLNSKEITVAEWIEIGKLMDEKAKNN